MQMKATINAYWDPLYREGDVPADSMRERMKRKVQDIYPEGNIDEV